MTWHTLSDQQPNDGERVLLLFADGWAVAAFRRGTYANYWLSGLAQYAAAASDRWARVELPAPAEPDGLRLVTTEGGE